MQGIWDGVTLSRGHGDGRESWKTVRSRPSFREVQIRGSLVGLIFNILADKPVVIFCFYIAYNFIDTL